MQLNGLITPSANDIETIDALANMMGESFMEENWTKAMLNALGDVASYARKLAISQELMRLEFLAGTSYPACYALPDFSACAGAYLKSDLQGKVWNEIEDEASIDLVNNMLTEEEAQLFLKAGQDLAPVSVFDWEEERAQGSDFIHFYVLGVDRTKRGSGSFRKLVEPFFDYADKQRIPCYLETYSEKLVSLYEHFGFEIVNELSTEGIDLIETCMERLPR